MTTTVPATDLAAHLRERIDGEVDASPRRRAEYSTDASNYRVPPAVVVTPRDADDLVAALDAARDAGATVTMRGGGTSVAGNSIGPGVVIDTSRHMNRILDVDADAGTARVQPGVVLSELQKVAAPHGLRFGPDPSTTNRATLGGMIGNNACGPHAVAHGKTAQNTLALDVITGDGRRLAAGAGTADAVAGLADLVRQNLALVRTEFGRFDRQVSGYSLEHLLPENGADLARFLVGAEGTLATTLEATVRLVPIAPVRLTLALGYADMPAAADAVMPIMAHGPHAVEGLDARLVERIRLAKGARAIPDLPPGAGWLFVEIGADTEEEAREILARISADAGTDSIRVFEDPREAARLWAIRADGAGLAGRSSDNKECWPGWEDAAVPPERLGTYLREFDQLMDRHGVTGQPFGHFGDGCIHVRLDIPLTESGRPLRAFMEDAAQAVAWARTSVADYGGDPDGLRLMGHSAGAHIAALLAADARYLRAAGMDTTALSGVAGLSGPYHFTPEEPDIKGIFGPPERYPLMQVSRHVNAATPPMLMLRGTDDETVGAVNAERLSRALRAAGVAHTVRHVPGLDHVGPIAEFVRTRRGESAVVRMVVDFLSDATAVT
ncbi:FAD-binding protein, partial [uncultured Demequina sp.]|uniref:FAD-binding protein n=1 Tax=uncultured Demequina sp. TaxID=693499 RepID=UPI0025F60295